MTIHVAANGIILFFYMAELYSTVCGTYIVVVIVLLLSHVQLFQLHQASLSMEFFRQEYWSEFPCLSPGNLPNPGMESKSPALQVDSLLSEPRGKPYIGVCVHTHTHTHTHIHTLYMFLYTYTVYVCVYICMCICIYIYTVEYYSAMTPDSLTRERDEAASRSLGRFSWWENCYLSCGHKALSNQKWRAAWM